MNIYEELGVEPIINAVGPSTRLSGSIMRAEVAESMAGALDDGALETVAGAGHQVMLQHPAPFAEVVLPFLLDALQDE